MKPNVSVLGIPRFVLICCALLFSWAKGDKTTRRFVGLPESGQRVSHNDTSGNNRTLIIRHNLPGKIIFHESNEFWIELQTTIPDGQVNNSEVKATYSSFDNETILLQVYQPILQKPVEANEKDKLVLIIVSSVGSFAFLCIIVSLLCYFCYWKKRGTLKADETTKEIPEENSTPDSGRVSQALLRRSPPAGTTPFMVVAVCACVLQAQLQPYNVDINVFFPKGFLRPDSKVFLKSENNNEIRVITNDTSLKINVFDVADAGLVFENRCSAKNLTCVNGACDPLAGKCVCPRKMRAKKDKEGQTRCVYRCDEKCQKGFFEVSPCNHTQPAVCKKCGPQCSFQEFESAPCAGKTDRKCTDISQLPPIKVSSNVVYEDVLKVKDDPPVAQVISNISKDSTTWLNRTSGLAIKLKMLRVDFSTTFKEVTHGVNDNDMLSKDSTSQAVLRNFCSSPVPDFYNISLQESVDKVRFIKGHPKSPCPSYDGSPSKIPVARNSLSCNGAENSVLRLFGQNSSPEDLWKEEKSQECYNNKQRCANCRERCTAPSRNDPICNVTEEDLQRENKQDYGEHFTYCFDCCFQANCICSNCPCSLYNTSCLTSQVTCVEAKHFTVPIQPIFPKLGDFKCHVEISQGPVFELEASVWKDKALLRRIETSERNDSQRAGEGRDYGFMVLTRPSFLRNDITKDILISGKAGEKKFNVGLYKLEEELSAQGATRRLYIQPKEPFIINSKAWPKENCQTMETDNFITIKQSGLINNFQSFSSLTAKIAYEHNERVYKVYNNSGSHYVHVELPQGRSVLKYAFPETVVLNDRSFAGRLLKNRTFWTIRLTGRVSSCPGFFVVRLTDQDRPDVEVYHYDIAITTEDCSFLVEFHLPSSGDTNSIDKQFVVRLTDSRKTLKLILVSPMGIPDIVIPNIDDDFDLTKLEVLIPFSSAVGGMVIVLIAILIYGYKTRPKDAHHRDRDNQLHFRHVLFVVWFVGMRLLKSFLLTLTVFSVILTAIYYTNLRTLQKYRKFHEEQKDLERAFMKQMDAHRVHEINRQWSVLGKGKLICDQKLKELNIFLEKYFKEMKERQEEEMRRKYIILAAKNRIDNQFKEARVKFERERKRMNEQLSSYSRELNSRLSQIQNKIEGSFWLKAARGLYKVLNGIAKTFGKSMKPFIRWVGLSVSFPNIQVSLPSFDDLFDDFALSSLTPHDSESNSSFIEDVFKSDTKVSIKEMSVPELNISSPFSKGRAKELLALDWIVQLYQSGIFTLILIVLDSLWFIYRHSKTYQLAVVLIHGFPKIYKLEQIQMKEEKKEKKKKKKEDKLQQKARNENDDGNEENSIEQQVKSSKGQDKINEETEIQELEHLQVEEEKKEKTRTKKKEDKLQPKGAKKARRENEDIKTIDSKENSLQLQERSGKGKDKINSETKIQELVRIQKEQEKKENKTKEDNLKKINAKKARQEKDKGKAIDCSKNSIDMQKTFIEGKNKINAEREEKTTEFRDVTSEQDVNTKPTEKEIVNEQDEIDGSENPRNSSKFGEDEPKWKKGINHGLKGVDLLNTAFVKFLVKLKELNYQINNTNLVPMSVLSVIAILSVYVVIVTAKHSMNVETLEVVGYFDLKMAPLLTMRKIVNTRITSSAFLVNEVHIPYYENRVNARIAFYRKKAKMYQAYQCSKADLHNEEYCSWREEESCQGVGAYNQGFLDNLTQFECNLEPVLAQRFIKFDRFRYKERHKKAMSPYVAALQGLILDTFYMILIVIGIFIVFKILGIAVFLLLKKFDLVRQIKHYQTNQDLAREMAVPHCIKYSSSEQIEREIRPIQLSEEMRRKFGPTLREGYSTQWVK